MERGCRQSDSLSNGDYGNRTGRDTGRKSRAVFRPLIAIKEMTWLVGRAGLGHLFCAAPLPPCSPTL